MSFSQNGWSANDRTAVSSRQIPGTSVSLAVRIGPAGDLLLYVASRFDREVEDIDNARGALDDWGYAERPIRGGTTLSNHASGTAVDLNATRHPLGVAGTFNATQVIRIRQIVAATDGCVRWGGEYTGRKDEMHFEINADKERCNQVAARLTEGTDMATGQDVIIALQALYDDRSGGHRNMFDSLVQILNNQWLIIDLLNGIRTGNVDEAALAKALSDNLAARLKD